MTPVKQTIFGNLKGNCFPACIASILDLPLPDVPHFCDNNNQNWYVDTAAWSDSRNLTFFMLEYGPDLEEFLYKIPYHYIVSGPSPRGAFMHCTVGFQGRLIHDPHPDETYFAGKLPVDYAFLIPSEKVSFTDGLVTVAL